MNGQAIQRPTTQSLYAAQAADARREAAIQRREELLATGANECTERAQLYRYTNN